MRKCDCYHEDKICYSTYPENYEVISRCYGTKECDPCNCGGDKRKCDFYNFDLDELEKDYFMTLDMMVLANKNHKTYISEDPDYCLVYNVEKGFYFSKLYNPNSRLFENINDLFKINDWKEI